MGGGEGGGGVGSPDIEMNSWEGEVKRTSEEKEMACGCAGPTGTDGSRWRGQCVSESSGRGRGGYLLSVRLVLLKTFFSKAICSFMEGNVSS